MEFLPNDKVEKIFERVPVKSLLRFKSVSKQWKLTIESQYFQAKQLIFSAGGRDLNLVLVSTELRTLVLPHHVTADSPPLKTNVLLKSSERYQNYSLCHNSCDGLVCLYDYHNLNIVFNPATLMASTFPCFQVATTTAVCLEKPSRRDFRHVNFGFGKDKISGIYKPVRLCNSSELGLENATTCEFFDFSTNTWRYINPSNSSPYRINACSSRWHALYLDGSLYWLTGEKEIKVLSLDLHTETFQVIAKAPFAEADPRNIITCSLDNGLCVSVYKPPQQVIIWSFNSENKAWEQIYSLVNRKIMRSLPLAILEKNKLLCCGSSLYSILLMIYDNKTKSVDSVSIDTLYSGIMVCYVESLISIL